MANMSSRNALLERPMCSLLTKSSGEDPIGSASAKQRYVIAEIPLPWSRAVRDSRTMPAGLGAGLRTAEELGTNFAFYGVVPDPVWSVPGVTRLIDVQRPAGPVTRFERTEYLFPNELLDTLTTTMLLNPTNQETLGPYRQDTSCTRDLLVCTQGTRDACCGSFGIPVYEHLRRVHAGQWHGALRVWRVSHIGGHRFAPTMIDLPEMRFWGHLTLEAVDQIVCRSGSLPNLQAHYRGWGALKNHFSMILEREAFQTFGWDWTNFRVSVQMTELENDAAAVELDYESPDGQQTGRFVASIEPNGDFAFSPGSCGDEESSAKPFFRMRELVHTPMALAVNK